jgi:hypothetical protein
MQWNVIAIYAAFVTLARSFAAGRRWLAAIVDHNLRAKRSRACRSDGPGMS